MGEYSRESINDIERKWQKKWDATDLYVVSEDASKPKYYVLDMFPYPSGAGLHVGHPLGYIASDITARYKRLKGFNVLHPMGFDAFGLPAEQYAIQTGQHPAITTKQNIETYKRQLRQIGLSFDWSREVKTSDPDFYKWTQWIFTLLFNSWYNLETSGGKTENIQSLIQHFESNGNKDINAACDDDTPIFTAQDWKAFNAHEKENILQKYRIAYRSDTMVNWCPALGTVLSNDEVKDGVSERGGHPVERIKMWQWSMRISAYAERLLNGLDTIDWPEPLKEMQRNWIGKSVGAELEFRIQNSEFRIPVFTTRIDTIFGVTFVVIAPEHELVEKIVTDDQRATAMEYVAIAKNRSERERMTEVKRVSGAFTGSYVEHPFTGKPIPVWIADYVLAGYGTGAVMAVPSNDTRDYAFAKHFDLPVISILEGPASDITKENFEPKAGTLVQSEFLNGLTWDKGIEKALDEFEKRGLGKRKVNYRMRDAIFGRQRYWGEPFPVYYDDGIPKLVDEKDLPVTLPEIDAYKPTETGEPPLARAKEWMYHPGLTLGLTPNPSPGERGFTAVQSFETSEKKYWNILKGFARENRKNSTEAEGVLWDQLRNNKLGYKIRRQHAIGIFIADFVSLEKRLVIEVDGVYHEDNAEYDNARSSFLEDQGYNLIRFTNEKVLNDTDFVVSEIKNKLATVSPPPSPPERGPGGEAFPFELTTMPGWAGSSWYWFRYMDPNNDEAFASKKALDYWKDVDLYVGGSEHATGHLLYSRFWCKALKDLGYVESEEPFKKLINQGMILGVSEFVYLLKIKSIPKDLFISHSIYVRLMKPESSEKDVHALSRYFPHLDFSNGIQVLNVLDNESSHKGAVPVSIQTIRIDIKNVDDHKLNIEEFKNSRNDFTNPEFILEDKDGNPLPLSSGEGRGEAFYLCGSEIEKMSKSKLNVVNPDDVVTTYGADTLRMYEMFLGPIDLPKPWNTNGIEGVFKFLRKFWGLFHDKKDEFSISEETPSAEELKILHRTIKKITEDIERFSFNTSVSEFMICCNELTSLKCNKRQILEPLTILLAPFAPHITEELWETAGHSDSVHLAVFPSYDPKYLTTSSFEYPISINGKVRAKMEFALDMPQADIEKRVLASEMVMKWTEGKPPKKVIIVPGRIVNVVL